MTNNKLFNEDTIRLRCSGCGKLFDITELKQCSACKQLFCADCQKTHDCTEESAAPAAKEKGHTAEMTDDEAYSAYVREINPFIECEECGESYPLSDMWKCPDCGMVLCQICREKHRCPKPENGKRGVLGFIPLLAGKKTAQTAETQEKEEQIKGDGVKEEEEELIVCDGCGKSYPKSKMRRCQNCGAVLCPKCRIRHSCTRQGEKKPKEQKPLRSKDTIGAEKPQNIPQESGLQPQKEKMQQETILPPLRTADENGYGDEHQEIKIPTPPDDEKEEIAKTLDKAKEPAPQSNDTKGKNEEEEIICDGCGKSFPKSKMRKCRECGDVLCPKCRKKHVCKTKQGDTQTKEQE